MLSREASRDIRSDIPLDSPAEYCIGALLPGMMSMWLRTPDGIARAHVCRRRWLLRDSTRYETDEPCERPRIRSRGGMIGDRSERLQVAAQVVMLTDRPLGAVSPTNATRTAMPVRVSL